MPNLSYAEKKARYKAKYPAKSAAYMLAYRATIRGTASSLLGAAKVRAKKYSVPFDLDTDFVLAKLQVGSCELSGMPLLLGWQGKGKGRPSPLSPSLDRAIPSLGYVKSNVRLVCVAVNLLRGDWGDAMLLQVATNLVAFLPSQMFKDT